MQFKPWSPELEARVNAWLAKVTNGIDPTTPSAPTASTIPSTTADNTDTAAPVTQTKSVPKPTVAPASDDDDLPF